MVKFAFPFGCQIYFATLRSNTFACLTPSLYSPKYLPNDRILDMTKLKALAGDKINVDKMTISVFDRVENIVGKGVFLWIVISHSVFKGHILVFCRTQNCVVNH